MRYARASLSGLFENQDATVVQEGFRCFTRLSFVEPVWVRFTGLQVTVERAELWFDVGNRLLDRLSGRLDSPVMSISNGGGGGLRSWMMPSQRVWRRRKNSICSGRLTAPAIFMGLCSTGNGVDRHPGL